MREVAFVQRVLPHYRHPFFQALFLRLAELGISLKVFYGQEYPGTVPKTVESEAPWAHRINNRYFKISDLELVWQPCGRQLKTADLIIVEQANRLLLNYLIQCYRLNGCRLAYYGHGRNFQARQSHSLRERWKRRLAGQVDWWFAYTEISSRSVLASGYPPDRVTLVNNAIDTAEFRSALAGVTHEEREALRARLGLSESRTALYCGELSSYKKLDFLIDACIKVRERVPNFALIVIGQGPEKWKIERALAQHSWICYVGPQYGSARAPYFSIAEVQLMPGLVGLAVVDSFVAEIPLVTTWNDSHGPEIAYLQNGINGMMAPADVQVYANSVIDYMESPALRERLRQGCKESAQLYTLENMVENFVRGILACLR